MDLEYLKSFCAVAQLKSFRKAAELLQVTQPAVSRRIKSLENSLGTQLLKRSPQSVSLTKAGSNFLPYAERLLNIMEEGTKKALDGSKEDNLTIAASSSTSYHLLPRLVSYFTKENKADVTIYTTPSPRVLDLLLDQTIDIGFTTFLIDSPLLTYEKVFEEDVIFVGHPALINQYIKNGELIKYPLPMIDNNINTPPWSTFTDYLSKNGTLFKTVIKSDYPQLMMRLVKEGVGFAFLPLSDVIDSLHTGAVERVPLSLPDFQFPSRPVYLFTYKDNTKKTVQCFKKIARQYLDLQKFKNIKNSPS